LFERINFTFDYLVSHFKMKRLMLYQYAYFRIRKVFVCILLLTYFSGASQSGKSKLIGQYSDGITELIIYADSSFVLKTPDYVYPYTFTTYQNRGKWIDSANVVTLNPHKQKRRPTVLLTEKKIEGNDSIQIKINYLTEIYENEILLTKVAADFNVLTFYLNKPNNYKHIVHEKMKSICAFAPKVKTQIVVDTTNTFKLPKQQVERLGIYTYGFTQTIELHPANLDANYFEITIIQPLDKERMPRSKQVIIKKNDAYFYEIEGKIPTSGLWLNGLKRID
jgi:hypothetical protein